MISTLDRLTRVKIHFAVYRTKSGNEDRLHKFLTLTARDGKVNDWTATEKFEPGDLVLFYFGKPAMSIVAMGVVASEWYYGTGPFDWTNKNAVAFCDFKPVWRLNNPIFLPGAVDRIGLQDWYNTKPYRSSREIKQGIAEVLLGEITRLNPDIQEKVRRIGVRISQRGRHKLDRNQKYFEEGGLREITKELHIRNPQLKTYTLAKYGYACVVCGFNFEEFYGDLGAGYIEVHHLLPISARKDDSITSIKDVTVVCANCHRVLHRTGKHPISLSKLRKAILRQKKKRDHRSK